MPGIVRFSHRRIINANPTQKWERIILEATWLEYRIQVQQFPGFGRYATFAEFLSNELNSESIHSRVSAAVSGNISALKQKIPSVFDANNELLELDRFSFRILDTDFLHQDKHEILIDLISKPMVLISESAIGFLTTDIANQKALSQGEEVTTLLIPDQKGLNVYSFKKAEE